MRRVIAKVPPVIGLEPGTQMRIWSSSPGRREAGKESSHGLVLITDVCVAFSTPLGARKDAFQQQQATPVVSLHRG
jgi:hypothetical protein